MCLSRNFADDIYSFHKYEFTRLFLAGTITTKARIDYESIKQIYVNAYVTDTGIPQMTSTAEIIVEIVNMNDNEPVFSLPEYRFTVAENSPKGNFIGKINAKDDDDGKLFVHTTLEQKSLLSYPLRCHVSCSIYHPLPCSSPTPIPLHSSQFCHIIYRYTTERQHQSIAHTHTHIGICSNRNRCKLWQLIIIYAAVTIINHSQ